MDVRDFEGARRALGEHRAEELEDPDYVGTLLLLAAALGDRAGVEEATRRLDEMASRGVGETRRNLLSFRRAEVAALLGDKDMAVSWLARACREGFRFPTTLHFLYSFDRVRDHPSFVTITRPWGNAGRHP